MMKQTLYEKIKIIVESGNIAITQDKDGNHMLRSSLNKHGGMRSSFPSRSLENCYYDLGYQNHDMSEIEKREGQLKYIGIYERPLRRPKVGQKVQVLPKWLKLNNYSDRRKDIAGGSLEVFGLKDGTCIIKCTEYDYLEVPYDCIAPRVEIDTI